ncbi:MAG: cache domain-containing protein [Planctomycetota bacterium]|jgi:methyl-accepting chemotaxis protein
MAKRPLSPRPRKIPKEPAKPASAKGPERSKRSKSVSLLIYLIVICCFGNLLPYIITTSVNCGLARGFIRQEAFDHLVSVRDIKKRELENYFFERRGDAYQLCTNILFKWAITSYIDAYRRGGSEGKKYAGIDGVRYKEVDERYHKILSGFADAYGYYDVLIVDPEGNVVASARKNPELGQNLAVDKYKNTTLYRAFEEGKVGLNVTDMEWYEAYNGPAQFVSSPIMKDNGESSVLGVLILFMDGQQINEMMEQRPGLKESGETYLVNESYLMLSDSRFTVAASEVLKLRVDTKPVALALEGTTGVRIAEDYRDTKVLSAYTYVQVAPDVRWALLAEIDKAEALSIESSMITRVVWMTFAMIPIWAIIVFVFFRIMRQEFLYEDEER